MQRTQFDRRILGRDDKIGRTLLVAQKQILGMTTGERRRATRAPPRP